MSSLINAAREGARTRVPRFAEAAVERARLTVVPPRRAIGRTQAARTPFAVVVIAMLVAGVVGLLMFNTNMQQASFKATALQGQVNTLTAKEQSLSMELDALRNPQRLAVAAKKLGMVAPGQPAFIRLDGAVLGAPAAATSADAVRINPLPTPAPPSLKRKVLVIRVAPKTPPAGTTTPGTTAGTTAAAGSQADTPGTSTTSTRGGDRKNTTTDSSQSGATH
jgi:outer membrane murein-binding lipoprotein Lpp